MVRHEPVSCAAERAWHRQRRHFGSAVGALPPFGVDGTAASSQCGSARCSSYSVSAQSSTLPGSSPVSDVSGVPGGALVALGAATTATVLPDAAAAPRVGDTPQQLGRAPAQDAVQTVQRRFQSSQLLAEALRDACGSGGAACERRMEELPRAGADATGASAAAAQPSTAERATAARTAHRRDVIRPGLHLGPAADEPVAGISSTAAGEAAARSQRAHVLWPIDNVQGLFENKCSPLPSAHKSAPASESSAWSWRGMQSPISPCVSTLDPAPNLRWLLTLPVCDSCRELAGRSCLT